MVREYSGVSAGNVVNGGNKPKRHAMSRRWRYSPHDSSLIAQLARQLNCSPLLAQVLVARGVMTGSDARAFLSARLHDLHDPDLLSHASAAASRIVSAIHAKRRITVYGDYDVDGVTATSILWHCLKLAGAEVDYYIPSRLDEGYGLNVQAIRKLHEQDPRRLVVSVDCGICSIEEAALAKELGLELIITDHHMMGDELPCAAALVHPQLPESDYPFPHLCGAGVAFKLAWAVCQQLGDGKKASRKMRDFLVSALGLAAMGTIADVVPLVGENRIIVHNGLRSLSSQAPLGLKTLMQIAGIDMSQGLKSEDIGYALGPRINAAGRLGQARLAVELLTTDNVDRAQQLANYVDQLNKNRQTVERKIFKQAKTLVHDNGWQEQAALVLAHPEWHPGVIGIVASRVAEHFQKPAILIALNEADAQGAGSGRSFAQYDLHAGLAACEHLLLSYGGHKAAAGLRIAEDQIDDFRESFSAHVAEHHEPTAADLELTVDAEVSLADLTLQAVRELEQLGPFGCQNHRPIFVTSQVDVPDPPQRMGGGERHLSLRVAAFGKSLRAIAFGKGDWAEEIAQVDGPISVCYTATLNRFRGHESVELHLLDWQPDAADAIPPKTSASISNA